MSGVVAYTGGQPAAWRLFDALGLLEQHGYDSAGIAIWHDADDVTIARAVDPDSLLGRRMLAFGRLEREGGVDGRIGIGHSRTGGAGRVRERNAHPLVDCTDRVVIVSEGVVRNADRLRRELADDGHVFLSDADSEVVAHLVEVELETEATLLHALERAQRRLDGSWAIVVLDARTGELAASAHGVPLVVARSDDGVLLASDVAAIRRTTSSYQPLADGAVVGIAGDGIRWRRDGRDADEPSTHLIG